MLRTPVIRTPHGRLVAVPEAHEILHDLERSLHEHKHTISTVLRRGTAHSPSGRTAAPCVRDTAIAMVSTRPRRARRTGDEDAHVPAELDLVEREAALGVDPPERAHAVDDEAVVLDRLLEALLSAPCRSSTARRVSHRSARANKGRATHTSCSGG